MKISKSKQELAHTISENGGWRDEAKCSSQDKDGDVNFFTGKPKIKSGWTVWSREFITANSIYGQNVIKNWHQTILSREEYFHLYKAPDADGWIEWSGGECPVCGGLEVDVRFRCGDVTSGNFAGAWMWGHGGWRHDIIAYRLHKPDSANSDPAQAAEAKQTIEQLASDYRNAKDYAERKQQEADAAKADADSKLKALELSGEAIGLLVLPITTKQDPELVITDWRDWIIGDLVMLVNRQGGNAKVGEVGKISKAIGNGDFRVDFPSQSGYSVEHTDIKFINRP